MNIAKFSLIIALLLTVSACGVPIPAGHVGRTWEPSGFSGELLSPGYHPCYGRCKMYHMESTDQKFDVKMNVLCADNLNFGFDIQVLVAVNMDNEEAIREVFENLKPRDEENRVFTVAQLFHTYIQPIADEEARKIVSKYKTSEIVAKRPQIIQEVKEAVMSKTSSEIMKVKRVTVGNLDFPDIVTKAQESKAQRMVEIETARAEAEKQKARAEGRLSLARVESQERILRAQAQADANRILASSVSPQLIMWRQWDVMENAADGENNMFFIPYRDASNDGIDVTGWANPQKLLDADLASRLQKARESSTKPAKSSEKVVGDPKPSKDTEKPKTVK